MKNVFLFLFIILGFHCKSQNLRNSNWIFGVDNGLNFNTSNNPIPYAVNTSPIFDPLEGCASVSNDLTGELLFFSDGNNLWRNIGGNFTLLTNSLKGHDSSAQNVIIVPKPDSTDNYYIITIDGNTGDNSGIYFSELDLSLNSGIGGFVSLNTPLKDQNNNSINETYFNRSEAITVTNHNNGNDFWIIVHTENTVNSCLLSYLVTSNGINVNPVSFLQTPFTNNQSDDLVLMAKVSFMSNYYNNFAYSTYRKGVYLGHFDLENGSFNMNFSAIGITGTTTPPTTSYGLEFSRDKLYYTVSQSFGQTFTKMINYIYLFNPSLEYTLVSNTNLVNSVTNYHSLQIKNGGDEIYCTTSINFNNITALSKISNINLTPVFQYAFIPTINVPNHGLPQNVPKQNIKGCPITISLVAPSDNVYANFTSNKQASELIIASNTIYEDGIGIYHAGESIVLSNGFHSDSGSKFRAYIEGCSNIFEGRSSNSKPFNDKEIITNIETEIRVYPNPTNSIVTIETDKLLLTKIIINSIEGKEVYNRNTESTNETEINISNLSKGIYLLTIETIDGKAYNKKLVKN